MTKIKKSILVTGAHRSGTTWVGKMLAAAPHTSYVHEPFNICNTSRVIVPPFTNWFQYISEENGDKYEDSLKKILAHEYPLQNKLRKVKSFQQVATVAKEQGQFLAHRVRNSTPIVKDPIAVFSAAWLAETLNMNVLMMIRHPAAFCSSLKLKNWQYDFSNFLDQPLLMERYLGKFEGEIREHAAENKDIISQAILLWNCIYSRISAYKDEHPDWLFLRHEDISTDPVGSFQTVYALLGLKFTPRVESTILASSGLHNPVEQQSDNEFIRNSKKNILNWQTRLTEAEILRIREGTAEVASQFYSESEW
ncbi:MAG: sulfotransferase [Cyanobacteria bacterium P01_A01_bin.135]